MSKTSMYSIGQLARRVGRAVHQVRYVLDDEGIQPIGRVAHAHVYGEAAAKQVEAAFARRAPQTGRLAAAGS